MWTAIVSFLGGLFSSSKMQDVAIDGIRKLGGLDAMTDKEKADYLLAYLQVTQTQSPMRRFIAFVLVGIYTGLVLMWAIPTIFGTLMSITPALALAKEAETFLMDHVLTPFNLILSFYFVVDIAKRVGNTGGK